LALPVAALAIGGVLLWMHLRSAASLLVAMGFAATFLGQFVDLVSAYELSSVMRTHPDVTYFVAYHRSFGLLMHYVGLLGLWVAAAGLIWHALALPQPAPPSQPLHGP
jgi:hypothetical protein